MKEQAAKMEGLKAELAGMEKDLEAHEQKTVDYRHAIDKYDGVIKENASKIRHWKKEVRSFAVFCFKIYIVHN